MKVNFFREHIACHVLTPDCAVIGRVVSKHRGLVVARPSPVKFGKVVCLEGLFRNFDRIDGVLGRMIPRLYAHDRHTCAWCAM